MARERQDGLLEKNLNFKLVDCLFRTMQFSLDLKLVICLPLQQNNREKWYGKVRSWNRFEGLNPF